MHSRFFLAALLLIAHITHAQYTHADTLKGAYNADRSWWDVLHYDINVRFNLRDSSVAGSNRMTFRKISESSTGRMQVDLMQPMSLDSVVFAGRKLPVTADGEAYYFTPPSGATGSVHNVDLFFHGRPKQAKNAPWDGGIVWSRDKKGNPWISIACEGMAARVWLPNKDHQADEPDSMLITLTVPLDLVGVSNGRLERFTRTGVDQSFTWKVQSPINNYNIIPYLGKYQSFHDTLNGLNGVLDLDYWVLEGNMQKARTQFAQVKSMIHCFEEWFGPYPFYRDSYKLVEAPYLGMEHQSGIAYGNDYVNGYRGRDLSNTGWGLKWDFLIIHESGHEWFGNNITAKDVADNWIHESFTAYSENLYTEWLYGKEAGSAYVIGTRAAILNDKPMIGPYDVNRDGSGDVYFKGANMLHTLRQVVNNDSLWKAALRGLNRDFRYRTVTSREIEQYLSKFLSRDLGGFFDQYLRTTNVPRLEYKVRKNSIKFRWVNTVKSFAMPVKMLQGESSFWITPTKRWRKMRTGEGSIKPDPDFYIQAVIR